MKPFINNYEDILELLDEKVHGVEWNRFYEDRERPVPFITQNTMPDENLVSFLKKNPQIKSAVEFGCGEGRNAIYMAKQGIEVTAYDLSESAIENAKSIMADAGVTVNFVCKNVIKSDVAGTFDFAYDSGMLHHLAPHRRLTYIEILRKILKPGGYFGLTCFAWGENCGEEMTDWEYYEHSQNSGLAYTKERLEEIFQPYFKTVEIRKYENGIPDTIQGLQFMWTCLYQKED